MAGIFQRFSVKKRASDHVILDRCVPGCQITQRVSLFHIPAQGQRAHLSHSARAETCRARPRVTEAGRRACSTDSVTVACCVVSLSETG